MKLVRMFSALLVVIGLAGVAYVSQVAEPSGMKMVTAADKLVASLSAEQKAKAVFDFDNKERLNWYFTPQQDKDGKYTRKGLPLEEMTEEQRTAAKGLLAAGTSGSGYTKATTIMSLESILRELEKNGRMVRNPGWYFFTIFGNPSKTGKWGWRVEGHHLSLNFTMDGGKVTAATPAFFGANPAELKSGSDKGKQTLPEAEEYAKKLFQALDDGQKQTALQKDRFPEIGEHTPAPKVGAPKGLSGGKMTEKQRETLWQLVEAYARRLPDDIAMVQLVEAKKAGIEHIHFAYTGGLKPGEGHTYRVQGPTFVIEFLNEQADSAGNKANHIHSAWRNMKGDFGLTR
jgi:hypothetical protein